MTTFRGFTTAVAVGGAVVFGGLAFTPAQQGPTAGIDVDRIATELGLTGEAKADLTKLNDLLVRRAQAGGEAVGLQRELYDVFTSLLGRLTFDQRRQLHWALRQNHGASWHMSGHVGTMDGPGCLGAFQGMAGAGGIGHHGMAGTTGIGHHSGMWRGSGN